jgi:hypothetical protein
LKILSLKNVSFQYHVSIYIIVLVSRGSISRRAEVWCQWSNHSCLCFTASKNLLEIAASKVMHLACLEVWISLARLLTTLSPQLDRARPIGANSFEFRFRWLHHPIKQFPGLLPCRALWTRTPLIERLIFWSQLIALSCTCTTDISLNAIQQIERMPKMVVFEVRNGRLSIHDFQRGVAG